jgi:hypothetical protein
MTTAELIRELQKEDPEGTCQVRTSDGGAVFCCEGKAGYWDGPYSYIDKNEFVITDKDNKVDIHSMTYETWIWDNDGDYSNIRVEVHGDKKKYYLEKFEEISKEAKRAAKQHNEEFFYEVLNKIKEGWAIAQPLSAAIGHYHVMWFLKDPNFDFKGTDTKLNQGQCDIVLNSGFFVPIKTEKNIEWHFTLANDGYRKKND